jgi:hypothetical protein
MTTFYFQMLVTCPSRISLSELFLDSEFVLELDAMASAASRISMENNMGNVLHEHDDVVTWVVVTVA